MTEIGQALTLLIDHACSNPLRQFAGGDAMTDDSGVRGFGH
ncbi:MAG: hypothetical protein Q8L65_18410 [Burkholderiales bacterium]|nr:hypothetical protein [Burkholderiales bacterium]MDP2398540.1 hypothetical protein [Burkholderiales bacterium]